MATEHTFILAGYSWRVAPLHVDAQIEVEFILIRMLGPGVAGGAATAVQELAGPLVEVLRATAERRDLDALSELSLESSEVKGIWSDIVGELQTAALGAIDGVIRALGEAVRFGVPEITDRLRHTDALRLFELAVLDKKTLVEVKPSQWRDVTDYATLGKLLQQDPQAKYRLLAHALSATYAPKPAPVAVPPAPAEDA